MTRSKTKNLKKKIQWYLDNTCALAVIEPGEDKFEIVKWLLKKGADPNKALMSAINYITTNLI